MRRRRLHTGSPSDGAIVFIAQVVLLFAIAFNLYHLYAEVSMRVHSLNDGVLHLLSVERLASAFFQRHDPSDLWLAPVAQGYPLFHHYQHLAYLPPAALHFLSGAGCPPWTCSTGRATWP